MRVTLAVCSLLLLLAPGCSREARADGRGQPSRSPPASTPSDAAVPAISAAYVAQLLVTDREALQVIEQTVGDLGKLAFEAAPHADNATLWKNGAYRAVMEQIANDVRAIGARDPRSGVGIRGHAHRLFDERFLRSRSARFELVAVANRMDRQFFNPAGCGELRLIYRLAYRESAGEVELASRLPMTVALELRADPVDAPSECAVAARRWLTPAGVVGRALGSLLVAPSGPLAARQLTRARIVQLVSNLQTVRWPSAVRPELGGHAEYALRAFEWDAASARYRVQKLENTPDVPRLLGDPTLKQKLSSWLAEPQHLAQLDSANVRLPDQFLAETVVSVTPRGLARRANRPFRSLFEPALFAALDLQTLRFARSPEALLRRLDDLTCSGCHQSRSIAGFHLLGDDAPDDNAGNALSTGTSPHTRAELTRRESYLRALASGRPVDLARPLAERAALDDGGYGAHCGLGDPGFVDWTCALGLRCDAYEAAVAEQTVGVCLSAQPELGDPCEPARVRANRDAQRDRVESAPGRGCGQICESTKVGFPGGMCAASCSPLPAHGACGGIAVLTPFNDCLARMRPFSECVRDHVRPAGLRACSEQAPCRDDYVCARTATGEGACLPPYFVFQLRVDGHPVPR